MKKFLKYFLFVILGLILLYFLIGFVPVKYDYEIEVDKPLNEVWAVVQDDSKYDQWLEGFRSIELISGTQNEVGSKYKVIVEPQPGSEFEMTQTLLAIDEFKKVDMHYDSEFMDFLYTITFSESDGKSKVRTDSNVKGKNFLMKPMFSLMEMLGGAFSAQEGKNMEALKKVIEENTTDYYPVEIEEVLEVEEGESEI